MYLPIYILVPEHLDADALALWQAETMVRIAEALEGEVIGYTEDGPAQVETRH